MKNILIVLFLFLTCAVLIGCDSGKILNPDQIAGLVGYWKFDGNAQDASGKGNHGKWIGKERYSEDAIFGQGASFDGISSYVSVPNSETINVGKNGFSFGAWVSSKGKGNLKNQHFLNKRDGGQGAFWDVYMGPQGEHVIPEIGGSAVADPPGKVLLFQWHHILITRDDSGVTTAYIDGKAIKSGIIPGDVSNTHNFNIGNLQSSLDQGFTGYIDEVVIYNRKLKNEEVLGLYLAGKKALSK